MIEERFFLLSQFCENMNEMDVNQGKTVFDFGLNEAIIAVILMSIGETSSLTGHVHRGRFTGRPLVARVGIWS